MVAQLAGDVPLAAAIAAVGQHQALDGIANRGIVLARRANLPVSKCQGQGRRENADGNSRHG